MPRTTVCLPVLLLCALPVCPDGPTGGADFVATQFRPFVEQYCLKCHGETKPKGNLSLAGWKSAKDLETNAEKLATVLERLKDGSMPPEGKPQPKAEERTKIVAELQRLQAGAKAHPGRVTLRRLNRVEYNNTVRDLLSIDFKPADNFPSDEVGYGFDHIGDVLSLSPLLMEKYLKAAERITNEGLTIPPPPKPPIKRVLAKEFKAEPNSNRYLRDGRVRVLETGELLATLDLPTAGKYRLKLQTVAEPAGDEKPRFTLTVDGKSHTGFTIEKDKGESFTHDVNLPAGKHEVRLRFDNPFKEPTGPAPTPPAATTPGKKPPKKGDPPKDGTRRIGFEFLEVEGPRDLPPPAPPAAYRRLFTHQPSKELSAKDAARKIIAPLAQRAYRRPVTPTEIEKLLKLFAQAQADGESFESSVRFMVQGLLVSPHFLFRVELRSKPSGEAKEELESYALASRLSYFLWSSMPDEELFTLAQADKLRDPAVLAQQVRRMLKDKKAHALTENFAGQWLQLRSLAAFSPDPQRFPGFDDELRLAFAKETELFFEAMLTENRPLGEFLTADFTYLNERLAKHYGIAGVKGPEFRRVKLTTDQRGGLLGHGSILTVTSNPTRTSPVKRGKWILENLLASPPPPPPPGVGDLPDDDQTMATGSLRQKMEVHRKNPSCATCHNRLDPLGFALENYDAIGRWRTKDGNFVIDAAGSLPDGQSFKSAAELKVVLAARLADFRQCLAEKLLTYALGRGLESTDRPYVLRLAETARQQDDRLVDLIVAVVQSEPFRFRLATGHVENVPHKEK